MTMTARITVHKVAGGDVQLWHDPTGEIFIKTIDWYNDPVELNVDEATELAEILIRLVREIKESEGW